ncbi:GNAT family N-acetyltransferase [Parasedimentitalea psychrophila]|uniref:GNAT family N-acetyltransferase n=1 Tax=Parasedimentitalea psychrophila TaxID=2997337 RepID=A0A9Y2KY59_9RHOB|nr:GNAT family N-acetyltransferase [Parasedimentitalea psychrophila]WIY24460.1 GNAT family N-acetyltransferase [Parasedimentitalea psychrophila]
MLSSNPNSNLTIRALTAEDHPEWRRLWTAYLEFYETTVDEEVYQTAFERLLSKGNGEFQGVVAETDGQLVGLAHFLFHRTLWSIEDTCYLMDLFVDPGRRGGGIGRALIGAVHGAAKANGIPGTYWLTQETNNIGRMLYDQVAEQTPFIVYEKRD